MSQIELAIRTREVYQLFERKIQGDCLFLDAILKKINSVANTPDKIASSIIAKNLSDLTSHIVEESRRFETFLAKKAAKIDHVIAFRPLLNINNSLAMQLVKFIEAYDQLISTVKLLRLFGMFTSDKAYFEYVWLVQKRVNRGLSGIVLIM